MEEVNRLRNQIWESAYMVKCYRALYTQTKDKRYLHELKVHKLNIFDITLTIAILETNYANNTTYFE